MKSISKLTIALLFSLLIPTASSSQTIYPKIVNDSLILLTSSQLKHTNLIFAEHHMLLEKVDLLESQTQHYKKLIRNYEQNDSLNLEVVETQKVYYLEKLASFNEELKKETKKRKVYQAGLIGTVGAAILALIFIK
jgi:hypothetical protein